jgi:hypothetical protein
MCVRLVPVVGGSTCLLGATLVYVAVGPGDRATACSGWALPSVLELDRTVPPTLLIGLLNWNLIV